MCQDNSSDWKDGENRQVPPDTAISENSAGEHTQYLIDIADVMGASNVEDENEGKLTVADYFARMASELEPLFSDLDSNGFWKRADSRLSANGRESATEGFASLRVSAPDQKDIVTWIAMALAMTLFESGHSRMTIVRERYHIDAVYRDCYYTCYSRQHVNTLRYSQRLSFYYGNWAELPISLFHEDELQSHFMGSCVINPVQTGAIGRTLVDPKFLITSMLDKTGEDVFVRTSTFKNTINGTPLNVEAFPYRSQDGLTLRCVEVTLVNLVEYYSNEYADYSAVLPSHIHEYESEFLNERTIPAKGISYLTASKLLHSFGFQPRLHGAVGRVGEAERFRRTFHHYVDSGIPVAMNLATKDGSSGHSLLCIGFSWNQTMSLTQKVSPAYVFRDVSPSSEYASNVENACVECGLLEDAPACSSKVVSAWNGARQCELYFPADGVKRYVVMDDNQPPYSIRDFNQLSLYSDMENSMLLVALHRGIMLDARDAEDCVIQLLSSGKTGLFNWGREYLQELYGADSPVKIALRLFLASSRRFKSVREKWFREKGDYVRAVGYGEVVLPHFVWVAELYALDTECACSSVAPCAFAEVVVDATFGRNKDIESSAVIWDYPDRLAFRSPDGTIDAFGNFSESCFSNVSALSDEGMVDFRQNWWGIQAFDGNLTHISKTD